MHFRTFCLFVHRVVIKTQTTFQCAITVAMQQTLIYINLGLNQVGMWLQMVCQGINVNSFANVVTKTMKMVQFCTFRLLLHQDAKYKQLWVTSCKINYYKINGSYFLLLQLHCHCVMDVRLDTDFTVIRVYSESSRDR